MKMAVGSAVRWIHVESTENPVDRDFHKILLKEIMLAVKQDRIKKTAEAGRRHTKRRFESHKRAVVVGDMKLSYRGSFFTEGPVRKFSSVSFLRQSRRRLRFRR
jgi:hypothetical protein